MSYFLASVVVFFVFISQNVEVPFFDQILRGSLAFRLNINKGFLHAIS
jgi:hypothetical protein